MCLLSIFGNTPGISIDCTWQDLNVNVCLSVLCEREMTHIFYPWVGDVVILWKRGHMHTHTDTHTRKHTPLVGLVVTTNLNFTGYHYCTAHLHVCRQRHKHRNKTAKHNLFSQTDSRAMMQRPAMHSHRQTSMRVCHPLTMSETWDRSVLIGWPPGLRAVRSL